MKTVWEIRVTEQHGEYETGVSLYVIASDERKVREYAVGVLKEWWSEDTEYDNLTETASDGWMRSAKFSVGRVLNFAIPDLDTDEQVVLFK